MRDHILRGAKREALVTADLLQRGFEVFKAEGNFSCDLIALKHNLCLRIEVKGLKDNGRKAPTGPVASLSKKAHHAMFTRFDILATVGNDDQVFYNRSITHTLNRASLDLPLRETRSNRTTHKNIERARSINVA